MFLLIFKRSLLAPSQKFAAAAAAARSGENSFLSRWFPLPSPSLSLLSLSSLVCTSQLDSPFSKSSHVRQWNWEKERERNGEGGGGRGEESQIEIFKRKKFFSAPETKHGSKMKDSSLCFHLKNIFVADFVALGLFVLMLHCSAYSLTKIISVAPLQGTKS